MRAFAAGLDRVLRFGATLAALAIILFASAGSGRIIDTREPTDAPKMIDAAPAAPAPTRYRTTARDNVLIEHLSRRYRIARGATERLVVAAREAGSEVGLDPLLILAVIAVESRFNPFAESFMGAKGLMQIIPAYHLDKLALVGGEDAVLDAVANIFVGSRILSECISRNGGLEAGLQYYNGAAADSTGRYAQKVLAERERLRQAVSGGVANSATSTFGDRSATKHDIIFADT